MSPEKHLSNEAMIGALCRPARAYSRAEVLARPSPVPAAPGLYAWHFRGIPPSVSTEGCVENDGLSLLYVWIVELRGHCGNRDRVRLPQSGGCDTLHPFSGSRAVVCISAQRRCCGSCIARVT